MLSYSTFAWRWLYVVPFVLSMVIFVDQIAGRFQAQLTKFGIAGTIALVFISGSTRWVVSEQNYTRVKAPGFKLADENEIVLRQYNAKAKIEGLRLISPMSGKRL
jgi:hypothetical protein